MQCAPLTTATMCWLSVCILLAAAVSGIDSAATAPSPTVHTKNGQLIGSVETTAIEKREFFAFRGIRYAKPPVGPLRFKVSAQPPDICHHRADGAVPENGTYKALSFLHWCALARAIKAPQPIEPWTGTRNATDFGAKCLQTTFNLSQFWGEEDCLFLNVYTPGKVIL